jgi:response regulator RpfG family c-di-GMP phosphodiesterase
MPTMTQLLRHDFELVPCLTLEQAQHALRGGDIDLVIGGIHFDESRMFDLLRYAQADPTTRAIPFLCIKILDDQISPTLLQGVEIASRALGAREFIDFAEWCQRLSNEEASMQLRYLIHKSLP